MNNKFRGMKSLAVFDTTNSFKIKSNTINTVNIISDNIQTSSYTSSAVNTVVTPSVVYDGTYTVNANGSHNYVLAFNIIVLKCLYLNVTDGLLLMSAYLCDTVKLPLFPTIHPSRSVIK